MALIERKVVGARLVPCPLRRSCRVRLNRTIPTFDRTDFQKHGQLPLMCSLAVAPFPDVGTSIASIEYIPALEV
jgi:hypothetical protein